jgi:hypothetical protein
MNEVATSYAIPSRLQGFFAKPPVLIGESRLQYEQVLTGTIEAIKPSNFLEWLLVKDLVDLTWELRRLGKHKAALINVTWTHALRMILESHLEGDLEERRRVAQERAGGYFTKEGRDWVMEFLLKRELTEDAIAAQASTLRLPELDLIDRQMERARVSRMAIARDIQHHRVAGSWSKPDDVLKVVDATAGSLPLNPPSDQARLSS